MPVKLAKSAGFCMGVRRAINTVLEETHKSEKKIYTLGPLVHNRQAMEMLSIRNVKEVSSIDEIESGILYIRAHGITPELREKLNRPGVEVRDMTCPHVRRAQLIIQRHAEKGFTSIIIGDAGHAEVVGLLGYAGGKGFVVGHKDDLSMLPKGLDKVCVVAQTTQNAMRFDEIIPVIKEIYPNAEIHNTVCSATDDRQEEVRMLAKEVDAIIVVGGKHSANTVRLAEIARNQGSPTYHIETADELTWDDLKQYNRVGVTAGASTPNWVFRAVVDKANQYIRTRSPIIKLFKAVLSFCVYSYLYIGVGSAAMTYAAMRLLDIQPRFSYLFLSFMYVMSMHIINRYTDRVSANLNDPLRMRLLERFHFVFIGVAFILAGAVLLLSYYFGTAPFVLMVLCLMAGIVYNLKMIPHWLSRRIRLTTVKDIPGSKDLFLALAWAVVSVLLPCLAEKQAALQQALYVSSFAFIMVFIRSMIFGVKDLDGDRIVGKETFPLVMGHAATKRLVILCAICLTVIAILDIFFQWSALGGFLLLPVTAYVGFYLILFYRGILPQGILFEIIVDAQFIFTGLLAFSIPHGL